MLPFCFKAISIHSFSSQQTYIYYAHILIVVVVADAKSLHVTSRFQNKNPISNIIESHMHTQTKVGRCFLLSLARVAVCMFRDACVSRLHVYIYVFIII